MKLEMLAFLWYVLLSLYHTVRSRMIGDANNKSEFKITIYNNNKFTLIYNFHSMLSSEEASGPTP